MTHAQLLDVKDLAVWLNTIDGPVQILKGVSFDIAPGECVALVGESGSGKSVAARTILGVTKRTSSHVEGEVRIRGYGDNALHAPRNAGIRGPLMTMVSQDPMTSIDPVARIGRQLRDTILLRARGLDAKTVRVRSADVLRDVGIDDVDRVLAAWPHQLSGGLRQRVTIALAIVSAPGLLIADEPTTALDVTVQAQVLRMLRRLQTTHGMGVLLITHDMSVVRQNADRIAVMRAGEIVEFGDADRVLQAPAHPYTRGLLASTLSMSTPRDKPLHTVASMIAESPEGGIT